MGAAAIPIAVAVAGTAASAAISNQAQKKQEARQKQLIESMNAYKLQKSREGEAATSKFLASESPEAHAAEAVSSRDALAQNLNQAVGAQQAFETPQNFAGKVSTDYTNRVASNESTTAARLKRSIDQLAGIGAPGQSALGTSLRFGEAAGGVSAANSAANTVGGAYTDAAGNVRQDPYLLLASQIVKGAGQGYALRGLTGTGVLGSGVPTSAGTASTSAFT
jgi:hypothetical protein